LRQPVRREESNVTPLAASSDYRDLLAAICEQPSEDTPRLALADWLDEQRDEDDADRAEFIRLQVAIARPPWKVDDLIRSEQLLQKHETEWRRGERCGQCKGSGDGETLMPNLRRYQGIRVICSDCHGIGWLGPLAGSLWAGSAEYKAIREDLRAQTPCHEYERGFVVQVSRPLADVLGLDDKVTPWAVRLVRAEPVQRIVLSDQMPRLDNGRWWIQSGCNAAFSAIEEYWKDHPEQAQPETPAFENQEFAVFYQSRSVANLVCSESERLRALELAVAR
jgi:uncharacterized protein (TIGR02996 family)